MRALGDFMNQSIIFLVFVAVAELVFIIQHNYQASITLLILAILFSGLFFLSQYRKGIKSFITSFAERWKPPHQRVQKIVVGSSKAPNIQLVGIKEQDKKVSNNEGIGNNGGTIDSTQDSTSCVIPIPNARN
jgi:hypothetical protein